MKDYKLKNFKARLLEERRELQQVEERLAGPGGLGEPMDIAATELSAYDQHPGDYGSQMYERSKDFGLLENTRIQIGEIDEALQAIEDGSYGYCRNCGKEIPEDRLEALPMTMLCVDCKAKEEVPDPNDRPIEEEVLKPPFGRTFRDEEEYNAFDGEDSWQSVARFGTVSGMPEEEE